MKWIEDHALFFAAIVGGLVVSILASENHSPRMAAARIASGFVCAFFFTEPILVWSAYDPEVFRDALAGFLAMSGYAGSKLLVNIELSQIKEIIQIIRGKK